MQLIETRRTGADFTSRMQDFSLLPGVAFMTGMRLQWSAGPAWLACACARTRCRLQKPPSHVASRNGCRQPGGVPASQGWDGETAGGTTSGHGTDNAGNTTFDELIAEVFNTR